MTLSAEKTWIIAAANLIGRATQKLQSLDKPIYLIYMTTSAGGFTHHAKFSSINLTSVIPSKRRQERIEGSNGISYMTSDITTADTGIPLDPSTRMRSLGMTSVGILL